MDSEIKKLWVEALRSGNYKQCYGVLRSNEGGYCCFGVLCDVHQKVTNNGTWINENEKYTNGIGTVCWAYRDLDGRVQSSVLTKYIKDWANISLGESTLINMNDGGISFKSIANYIEERY